MKNEIRRFIMTKRFLAVVLAVAMLMSMSVLCINVAAVDDVEEFYSATVPNYTGAWMTIVPQADTSLFIEACEVENSTVTVTAVGLETFTWAEFILQNSEGNVTLEGGATSGNSYTIPGATVVTAWNDNNIESGTWYQICFQGTAIEAACDITVTVTAPKAETEPPAGDEDPGYVAGPLTLDDLGSGWSSSYDPETHTITFDDQWTGRGWWLGEDPGLTGYDSLKITFANGAEIDGQVVVEYVGETDDTKVPPTAFAAGDAEVIVPLDHERPIKQIYIQSKAAGTLTLGEVTMHAYFEEPDNPNPNPVNPNVPGIGFGYAICLGPDYHGFMLANGQMVVMPHNFSGNVCRECGYVKTVTTAPQTDVSVDVEIPTEQADTEEDPTEGGDDLTVNDVTDTTAENNPPTGLAFAVLPMLAAAAAAFGSRKH